MNNSNLKQLKLAFIGQAYSGKTSLLYRIVDKQFIPNRLSTLICDFMRKTIEINGTKMQVVFWDTAGQERFKCISAAYFRGANGFLILFDLNNGETLGNVEYWYGEIVRENPTIKPVLFLIGNKSDLQQRCSEREISKMAKKMNKMPIYYCSALNGNGCDKIFNDISSQMAINNLNEPISPNTKPNSQQKSYCLID